MDEEHPPKAQFVLRVGVTGHRLEYLERVGFDEALLRSTIRKALERIRDTAGEILRTNKDVYSLEPLLLRVISPLAEGSDRFVVEEALALGYELQSPLPFSQKEYEKDFTEESSKTWFRDLLGRATSILTLDGTRQDEEAENRAYEAVGRVVLRQSDVLIAVWDGQGAKGQGGTGQIVKESIEQKIPTLWIEAGKPHLIKLLEELSDNGAAKSWKDIDKPAPTKQKKQHDGLFGFIKNIFAPPQQKNATSSTAFDSRLLSILEPPSGKEQKILNHFFAETQPQFRASLLYRVFCKLFVSSWGIPSREVESFESAGREDWLRKLNSISENNISIGDQIEKHYRKSFAWSDVMADICADRHRSSYIIIYFLGALAVLAAFLGSPDIFLGAKIIKDPHTWFLLEFIFIGGIVFLFLLNRFLRWHERWIGYRLLAEGLRQMRSLAPFARVTPSFEVPAYLSDDTSAPTWFNWYFRALVRSAGLVSAEVTPEYLKVCRHVLIVDIGEQVRYHLRTARRNEALHKSLHRLSTILFGTTLLACILHLWLPHDHVIGGILMLCAIVLPAFGAAIQGIILQGEYRRLSHRSRALRKRLTSLRNQIKASSQTLSFRDLGQLNEVFSEMQIIEQTDWRAVFIIKGISLP
jgi:hypothetical protein